jgi:hypothetical protein
VRNAALQAQLEGEHAAREDVARDLATAAAQVRGQVSVSIGGGRVAPFYLPCTYPSTTMTMFHVLTMFFPCTPCPCSMYLLTTTGAAGGGA